MKEVPTLKARFIKQIIIETLLLSQSKMAQTWAEFVYLLVTYSPTAFTRHSTPKILDTNNIIHSILRYKSPHR
jgi:hypothetical protein